MKAHLAIERSPHIGLWKDVGDQVLPWRPRFTVGENNQGARLNTHIVDATPVFAHRTLSSGMMAGVTSPARPWFRLTTARPEMAEVSTVKEWLHAVQSDMSTVFLKSNLYSTLPTVYGDIGAFANSALLVEEDFDSVVRFYSFPVGSYYFATDARNRVNVFMREFRMTVRQIVDRFGKKDEETGDPDFKNISSHVEQLWKNGQLEEWINVVHVISPNEEYERKRLRAKFKRYSSVYYEEGTGKGTNYLRGKEDEDKFLRDSGYDYFPVLCPRWQVNAEDPYGVNAPAMVARGDCKALQLMHRRKAEGIEKMVRPPLKGPTALQNKTVSQIAGDITFTDERDGMRGLSPIYEVNPRIVELIQDIEDHRSRIRRAFFEDLFLMLTTSSRRDFTAREIDERHEEKLLALGPVLERLNEDLLNPLIDITFDCMMRQRRIPPPPQELQGTDLNVEYVSVMAGAQKMVAIGGMDRMIQLVANTHQLSPDMLDKIDFDQMVDLYGDMTGVPPSLIRSDDKVEEIRAAKRKAAQQQSQMSAIQQSAQTARELSQADMGGDNALSRLAQEMGVPAGGMLQ